MKRLRSIRLRVKRNIAAKTGLVDRLAGGSGVAGVGSMATLVAMAVDGRRHGPTAQELNAICKCSYVGDLECLELQQILLRLLTQCVETGDLAETAKLLAVLHFLFISGSEQFYYLFVNGHGVWKLKSLCGTTAGGSDAVAKVLARASTLLLLCQDHTEWARRRSEYQAIRNEIQAPTARHSFDSSFSRSSLEPASAPPLSTSSCTYTRPNRLSMALSLECIEE